MVITNYCNPSIISTSNIVLSSHNLLSFQLIPSTTSIPTTLKPYQNLQSIDPTFLSTSHPKSSLISLPSLKNHIAHYTITALYVSYSSATTHIYSV